jgi:sigma-B regulation protein RsbU (phosphoserine phosphatase)
MAKTTPRLTVRDAFGNQREVEIAHTPFTMGRQPDNDLVLLDNRISRRHARIVKDGQGYVVEDAGSRHGTFLNGERVESHRLSSGDQVTMGVADSYTIIFQVEEAVLPGLLEKFEKATVESPTPQLHHLGLLLKMAQMLLRAPALEEVLTALVDSAIQLANAERGLLFLREDKAELRLHLARGQGGVHLGTTLTDYSRNVVERVEKTGQQELILEEEIPGRTAQETGIIKTGVRGIVAVPLQKLQMTEAIGETMMGAPPQLLGVLYLDTRSQPAAVTGLDRQVLTTLAVEGATVIENARMFRLAREQERIQHEMFVARNIQQTLLPRQLPHSDYFQVCSVTMPTEAVGGDYYDVVQLPEGRCGFIVADVSGKGLPAAITAASLQGAFAAVAAGDPDIAELVKRVNDFLCERTPTEMFAVVFYGVLDRQGEFEFVNAGQVPPIVVRATGPVTQLDSSNFPLGFFPNTIYSKDSVRLQPGEIIVICSDGVTEARDIDGEMFGDARLRSVLEGCSGKQADETCHEVVAAVQDFVGSAPQADDLTVTVVRYGAL